MRELPKKTKNKAPLLNFLQESYIYVVLRPIMIPLSLYQRVFWESRSTDASIGQSNVTRLPSLIQDHHGAGEIIGGPDTEVVSAEIFGTRR